MISEELPQPPPLGEGNSSLKASGGGVYHDGAINATAPFFRTEKKAIQRQEGLRDNKEDDGARNNLRDISVI